MTTTASNPNAYQVIVSNVGTVYDGNDEQEAKGAYDEYRTNSELAMGRAAGEDVTLMHEGEPVVEYVGVLSQGREEATPKEETVCSCPTCLARRILVAAIRGDKASISTADLIQALALSTLSKVGRMPNVAIKDEGALVKAISDAIRAHVIIGL